MILPPVHQLIYSVQQDNISGSELLQLLQAKVTDHTLRMLPASAWHLASQCPAMSWLLYRHNVAFQSCSLASHAFCGTAIRSSSSNYQAGTVMPSPMHIRNLV